MSDKKYTPGPWKVSTWIQQPNNIIKPMVAANCVAIAITHPSTACKEDECQENANLIAAAPELFEALEEVFEDLIQGAMPNGDDEWFNMAKKAIAKAKGNT